MYPLEKMPCSDEWGIFNFEGTLGYNQSLLNEDEKRAVRMTQARRGKTFRDLVNEAKARVQETNPDEVRQWMKENRPMILVDVRESSDYAKAHIEGAVSVPRGILELEIDELVPDQDAVVVAYCGGGSRSALAAETLQEMGYENVFSMAGGWRGWSQSQPDAEATSGSACSL